MTRELYQNDLEQLHAMLLKMDVSIEQSLNMMITVLQEQDGALAREVIERDDIIDKLEQEIEDFAIHLITTQQPVASDLREVTSILKMITDLERIADQCCDVCEYVSRMDKENRPPYVKHVIELAQQVKDMFGTMMQSYIDQDETLAVKTAKADDIADDIFRLVTEEIVQSLEKNGGQKNAVFYILISKYLERMADHITNVCEWINYRRTGSHRLFN